MKPQFTAVVEMFHFVSELPLLPHHKNDQAKHIAMSGHGGIYYLH